MNAVSDDLEKSIHDNFARLGLYGMNNNGQVTCACNLLNGGLPAPPKQATVKQIVTVEADFVPGQQDNGRLSPTDPGNTPFILPDGVTQDTILQEQAQALVPQAQPVDVEGAAVVVEQEQIQSASSVPVGPI